MRRLFPGVLVLTLATLALLLLTVSSKLATRSSRTAA